MWCSQNEINSNPSKEDEIFPLTVKGIVEAKKADPILKHFFKSNVVLSKRLELQLVENESCICLEKYFIVPLNRVAPTLCCRW